MENQENLSSSTDGFVHLLKAAAAKQVKTAALASCSRVWMLKHWSHCHPSGTGQTFRKSRGGNGQLI